MSDIKKGPDESDPLSANRSNTPLFKYYFINYIKLCQVYFFANVFNCLILLFTSVPNISK